MNCRGAHVSLLFEALWISCYSLLSNLQGKYLMKYTVWARCGFLVAIAACTLMTQTAKAAAYQLYEMGTPVIGTAGVGQAALAEDASTAWFNPAGMLRLQGSQLMLGSQIMVPHVQFSKNSSNTIAGESGGNAGTLLPGMSLYTAWNYSPTVKFGIGQKLACTWFGMTTHASSRYR